MSAINIKSLSQSQIEELFDSIDTVLTDCDGVLWIYMNALKNSAEVLTAFRELGKKVFYITNNSTKTKEEFAAKCATLNFTATGDDILCTANLTACYLHDLGFDKKVYVIGSEAIGKELDKLGIAHCGIGPDSIDFNVLFNQFRKDPDVGAVVVGFDGHFSYPKMVKAASYLSDPNVHFIGTNTDERFPVAEHIIVPGTGSLVRCIESCSERKAVIMGKPEPYISTMLMKHFKIDPKRTLMIGDRCNTDILLGTRCGFKTLLVLTGVTSVEDIKKWSQSDLQEEKDLVPNYYIDMLGDLLPYLQKYKSKS